MPLATLGLLPLELKFEIMALLPPEQHHGIPSLPSPPLSDIHKLSMCDRSWRGLCLPFLWRNVNLGLLSNAAVFRFVADIATKYGHHVRELTIYITAINHEDYPESERRDLKNGKSGTTPCRWTMRRASLIRALVSLLSSLTSLTYGVDNLGSFTNNHPGTATFFIKAANIGPLASLQSFTMRGFPDDFVASSILSTAPLSITTLAFIHDRDSNYAHGFPPRNYGRQFNSTWTTCQRFQKLQRFSCSGFDVLNTIVRSKIVPSTSLTQLELSSMKIISSHLVRGLARLCSTLESLKLTDCVVAHGFVEPDHYHSGTMTAASTFMFPPLSLPRSLSRTPLPELHMLRLRHLGIRNTEMQEFISEFLLKMPITEIILADLAPGHISAAFLKKTLSQRGFPVVKRLIVGTTLGEKSDWTDSTVEELRAICEQRRVHTIIELHPATALNEE